MGQILGILNPELSCRSGVRWQSLAKGSFCRLCRSGCDDCNPVGFPYFLWYSLEIQSYPPEVQSYWSGPFRCDRMPRDSNLTSFSVRFLLRSSCGDCHIQSRDRPYRGTTSGPSVRSVLHIENPRRFCVKLRHGAMAEFHHPNVPENEAETSDDFDGWDCYTLQGIHISHLGERKIIFKMQFLEWDMFVPRRVICYSIGIIASACGLMKNWPFHNFCSTKIPGKGPLTQSISFRCCCNPSSQREIFVQHVYNIPIFPANL